MYEIIQPGKPFNMFLDMEAKPAREADVEDRHFMGGFIGSRMALLPAFLDNVRAVMAHRFVGVEPQALQIVVLLAEQPAGMGHLRKFSAHVVIKHPRLMMATMEDAAALARSIQVSAAQTVSPVIADTVDHAVYTQWR